jgi:PAS domain S-box-containing protein
MTTPKQQFNLDLFFELSPALLCIAGYDGFFKRINPTVSKTLGYTDEELFSKPINDFVYPEDRNMTAGYRDDLKHNKPRMNFENRYVTKTGEIVWLSWTSIPISNQELVFAIAKNITHLRRLEDDRNKELAQLTQINKDLRQLTYTTSHDLRSPVSNLLSIFNLLDVSKIEDEETREFIGMLRSATEDLKTTLNYYVDALSQKGVISVALEKLDMQVCLISVTHSLGSLIESSHTKINVNFSAFDHIFFNKAYLESIFLNLISNSIKYAKPRINPVIYIYTQRVNGINQLVFKDEGLGFDMEKVADRVFGFSQKFHDHADSKGIGLYLVYNHIVSLGGHITLQSQVNQGAVFTISFKD